MRSNGNGVGVRLRASMCEGKRAWGHCAPSGQLPLGSEGADGHGCPECPLGVLSIHQPAV